jgi:hypothetical protein
MSFVILFGWRPRQAVDIDQPENPENIILIENDCKSKSTPVHLDHDPLGRIEFLVNRCISEGPC